MVAGGSVNYSTHPRINCVCMGLGGGRAGVGMDMGVGMGVWAWARAWAWAWACGHGHGMGSTVPLSCLALQDTVRGGLDPARIHRDRFVLERNLYI